MASRTPATSAARAEHTHRCEAGHRWQHTGRAATACAIPVYSRSGGALIVRSSDCPACGGRDDLLVRGVHSHYCNLCDGDWEHQGRCVEGVACWCPWCSPETYPTPTRAVRRGPHYHYCPACGHSWQHVASCSAPLRAALRDCTGCRRPIALRSARPRRGRVRVAMVMLLVAAAAMVVSIAILLGGPWEFRRPTFSDEVRRVEPREDVREPLALPPRGVTIEHHHSFLPGPLPRLPSRLLQPPAEPPTVRTSPRAPELPLVSDASAAAPISDATAGAVTEPSSPSPDASL